MYPDQELSTFTAGRCAGSLPAPEARREIQLELLSNFAGVLGLMLNSGQQLLQSFAEVARSQPPRL